MDKKRKASIVIKVAIIVAATVGTSISIFNPPGEFMGGHVGLMYFTMQSNIALALISLVGAILLIMKKKINHTLQLIKYMGATSISLTGLVFCLALAPVLGVKAWSLHNVLTHVVVPVLSVVDFMIVGQEYTYKKVEAFWAVLPPMLYVLYAGIGFALGWRFSVENNYPYFFLNWGSKAGAIGFSRELPFAGPVWWITIVMGLLVLLGLGYFKLLKVFAQKRVR